MPRTKWDILTERAAFLRMQAQAIEDELSSLDRTQWGHECVCGVHLETEGDFARHFTVPDVRYLGLGDCPNRLNPGEFPARYASPGPPVACDECGEEIPRDAGSVEGIWHSGECSLYPENIG